MKTYALFIGCNIPARVKQYETAARAVLKELSIGVKDFPLFNCCGYPMRNIDETAYLLSAAKNLALAENHGLDILALCKCCFGSLKIADHKLREDEKLRADMNRQLAAHDLKYEGKTEIKHFLSVLYHDVGLNALKHSIGKSYQDLKIATHYGCHALRPSKITGFDNPVAPVLFDELVKVTGAESVHWDQRLECCGAPLTGIQDKLSMDLMHKKLESARTAEADYICVACPWCQIQFDTVQSIMITQHDNGPPLPSILYPQLIGLCIGLESEVLGIQNNRLDISQITSFFKEE
ncbi:MAG: disulfide reductase [Deltaproteobacteria bacterium]|nr:disulfide reductase [Deltaproteobacteria bacterium]MBW1962534.1 disulfide reductase [Deltaproteobacteria bacterium]MBW2152598.1 disulfide reductase [Deltaproteobacteria bacterium]